MVRECRTDGEAHRDALERLAPLTVNLDGSTSSDPDGADTIASYTFRFGDGSTPVTQSGPSTSHTYGEPVRITPR